VVQRGSHIRPCSNPQEGNVTNNRMRCGERTSPRGKAVCNKILLGLPDDEFRRMRPHLEFLELPNRYTLHEAGRKLRFAYFLNRGMASLVVVMRGERDVEAGVAGNEGFVGAPLIADLQRSPLRGQMQAEGEGFRVDARAFRALLGESPVLRAMLTRYAILLGLQVAQTAACNRLHNVKQRLARWLLLAEDRLGTPTLDITQDFLATMLGTDRPSVSLAASALQRSHAISYRRGVIRIRNRRRLESKACECYGVIRQFDGDLGLR
jgi:CRP-like cAMP-binding protein